MAIRVEKIEKFRSSDLEDLCIATEAAVKEGIGFNWIVTPSREVLEAYWRGVLVVPERTLFVGRLDGSIVGSVQLSRPGPNRQSQAFMAAIEKHFVAPWARGHGLAKELLRAAEEEALRGGYSVVRLDVRASQKAAITLYESAGYERWGVLDQYEQVNGEIVAGHFFVKDLKRHAAQKSA